MTEDASLFLAADAARWLVPVLGGSGADEHLRGSGVLVEDEGRLFLLTARHIFFEPDGSRFPGDVWFTGPMAMREPATQRLLEAHLVLNPDSVTFMPGRDIAFAHVNFEGAERHALFLAHAFPGALRDNSEPLLSHLAVVPGESGEHATRRDEHVTRHVVPMFTDDRQNPNLLDTATATILTLRGRWFAITAAHAVANSQVSEPEIWTLGVPGGDFSELVPLRVYAKTGRGLHVPDVDVAVVELTASDDETAEMLDAVAIAAEHVAPLHEEALWAAGARVVVAGFPRHLTTSVGGAMAECVVHTLAIAGTGGYPPCPDNLVSPFRIPLWLDLDAAGLADVEPPFFSGVSGAGYWLDDGHRLSLVGVHRDEGSRCSTSAAGACCFSQAQRSIPSSIFCCDGLVTTS